jgi:hypothetical protein
MKVFKFLVPLLRVFSCSTNPIFINSEKLAVIKSAISDFEATYGKTILVNKIEGVITIDSILNLEAGTFVVGDSFRKSDIMICSQFYAFNTNRFKKFLKEEDMDFLKIHSTDTTTKFLFKKKPDNIDLFVNSIDSLPWKSSDHCEDSYVRDNYKNIFDWDRFDRNYGESYVQVTEPIFNKVASIALLGFVVYKNKFYERGILLLNKAQKDWIVSYKIMVHFSGDLRAKDPIDEKSEWVEQNAGIYRGVYEQKRDSILLMHIKLLQ